MAGEVHLQSDYKLKSQSGGWDQPGDLCCALQTAFERFPMLMVSDSRLVIPLPYALLQHANHTRLYNDSYDSMSPLQQSYYKDNEYRPRVTQSSWSLHPGIEPGMHAYAPAFIWPSMSCKRTKRRRKYVMDQESILHGTQWTNVKAMLDEVRAYQCEIKLTGNAQPRPFQLLDIREIDLASSVGKTSSRDSQYFMKKK